MSSKSKRGPKGHGSPLGGYGADARRRIPDYVNTDAVCDAAGCTKRVAGSRTLTWVAEDSDYFSVLIRLCAEHTDTPIAELAPLLPNLPSLDGQPYMDLGEGGQ